MGIINSVGGGLGIAVKYPFIAGDDRFININLENLYEWILSMIDFSDVGT